MTDVDEERSQGRRPATRVPRGGTAATILHADLDSFYASVEQRDDPALRNRPIAVGGGGGGGVVLAASYEAKRFGVRTAMRGSDARRLCPGLVFVSPRFEAYTAASRDVFEIFDDTTPDVEGVSVDEAFLDVGGLARLAGPPVVVAQELRARVRRDVGLAITVGVARTKFLAKVASGVAKPDGLLVVEPTRELDFLRPLPVDKLWGVGQITAGKLRDRGIFTVGDVAELDGAVLEGLVGRGMGRQLAALSRNVDLRRVEVGKRRGSIGSQQALGRARSRGGSAPERSHDDVEVILRSIVDRVTRRLRRADRVGRTVVVRFRFDDFTRATRSHTLPHPTSATHPIEVLALTLLGQMWPTIEDRGLTLIGLSVANLENAGSVQLALPFSGRETVALDAAIDAIRDRFGATLLTAADRIGSDADFTVPLLPD